MQKITLISNVVLLTFLLNSEAFAGRSKKWPINEEVAPQRDTWTCGAHAGCTLLRSQGISISLDQMLNNFPHHNVFGFKIGPDSKKLANHMAKICQEAGNTTLYYESVKIAPDTQEDLALEELRSELTVGPILLLVKTGVSAYPFVGNVIQLHHLLVYGFDEDRNEFYAYDTNKAKLTLTGQQLMASWFWDTEDSHKAEFNPLITTILKSNETFAKMYVRSRIKLSNVTPAKETLTPEEQEEEDLQEALRLSMTLE